MNCPAEPFTLRAGDILVVSSDGLHSLSDEAVEQILRRSAKRSGLEIAEALLDAVRNLQLADHDNVSMIVIKVLSDKQVERPARSSTGGSLTNADSSHEFEVFDVITLDEDALSSPPRRAVGL